MTLSDPWYRHLHIVMRNITPCGKGEGLGKRCRQYPGPLFVLFSCWEVSESPRRTLLLGSSVNRGTPCILVRFFSRSPTRPASQPRPLPTAAPLAMEDIDPALLLIASKISSRLVEVLSTPTAPAPKARPIPEGVKTLLLSTNATASP